MPEWFTPPQVARTRGIRLSKILYWIATGELEAVNHATGVLGRPRWRISSDALANFDLARSNRSRMTPVVQRPRRRSIPGITEFF